jgi:hypothetical protein
MREIVGRACTAAAITLCLTGSSLAIASLDRSQATLILYQVLPACITQEMPKPMQNCVCTSPLDDRVEECRI